MGILSDNILSKQKEMANIINWIDDWRRIYSRGEEISLPFLFGIYSSDENSYMLCKFHKYRRHDYIRDSAGGPVEAFEGFCVNETKENSSRFCLNSCWL